MKISSIIIKTSLKKWSLCVMVILSVIGYILCSLLPPYILSIIIDSLTNFSSISLHIILFYFFTLLASNLMLSLRDSLFVVYGQKITHALRTELMNKYTHLPTSTIQNEAPGSIVSRFIGDVNTVETLFTDGIISLVADTITLISILVILFQVSRGTFMILLFLLPLLFLFTRHVQKNTLKSEIINRKSQQETNAIIPQTIHNIITIHNLNKQSYFEKEYDSSIEKGYNAITQTNFYDAVYSPIIICTNACVVAIVVALSSTNDPTILSFFSMSAGSAVMIINYISQIFSPIQSIGMEITTIQSAMSGIKRINEFLSLKEKDPSREESILDTSSDPVIQIHNISFSYGENNVLQDYSLSIHKGEHITLLGRTGSGKSTLFKLILGLYEPKQGTVLVYGKEPYHLNHKQRRKIFGYVEQAFHPVTGTIKDQITLYDLSITDEQVLDSLKQCNLYSTVQSFEEGIYTQCKEELFSKGQWQLLSIARAIVTSPTILMLDEITSSLDSESEKEILDTLTSVTKDRTVISISHRSNAIIGKTINLK